MPSESTACMIIKKLGSAANRTTAKAAPAKGKKKKGAAEGPKEPHYHKGNLSMDDIITMGRKLVQDGKFKLLRQAVMSVVGTVGSMHATIDNKRPIEVRDLLKSGYYTIPAQ